MTVANEPGHKGYERVVEQLRRRAVKIQGRGMTPTHKTQVGVAMLKFTSLLPLKYHLRKSLGEWIDDWICQIEWTLSKGASRNSDGSATDASLRSSMLQEPIHPRKELYRPLGRGCLPDQFGIMDHPRFLSPEGQRVWSERKSMRESKPSPPSDGATPNTSTETADDGDERVKSNAGDAQSTDTEEDSKLLHSPWLTRLQRQSPPASDLPPLHHLARRSEEEDRTPESSSVRSSSSDLRAK